MRPDAAVNVGPAAAVNVGPAAAGLNHPSYTKLHRKQFEVV